jgi:hypothetical protein
MTVRTHNLVAILPCNDMARSLVFYGRLGFRLRAGDLEYAMLADARGAETHLQPAVEGWLIPGCNPFGLYLYTEQVDDLAQEFATELLNGTRPEDKPWGLYEFAISDPDETLVRIGWPTRLRPDSRA